jgi:hypothetical protein
MHAEIDFQRACQAFLRALPAMNLYSMREGSERAFGKGNHILPIWKGRLRATTKVTTPNSDVIYAMSYLDLKDGPVVIEAPAGVQGLGAALGERPIPGRPVAVGSILETAAERLAAISDHEFNVPCLAVLSQEGRRCRPATGQDTVVGRLPAPGRQRRRCH